MRTPTQQNAIDVVRGWAGAVGGQAGLELANVVTVLEQEWKLESDVPAEIVPLPSDWHSPMPQGYRISGYGFTPEHPAYDIAPSYEVDDGIDDDRVYPLKDGTVVWAGWDSRWELDKHPEWNRGLYVMVAHGNGEESRYCHASELFVSEGHLVTADTPLGVMGNTGYAEDRGKHWHIGFTRNGAAVDWVAEQ